MSKRGIVRPAMAVLIILSMLLAACTSNTKTSNTPDSPEKVGTDSNEEVVTLRLLIIETGSKWNTYPDSAIAEEIAKKVGVKIEYVEADDSKFNVLLAGETCLIS